MLRADAVRRINDGIGFRPDGHSLEDKIVLRLQEAQRDLEKGKTIPPFLLQEDQTLSLLANTNSVALPTGFIRIDDDNLPHYFSTDLPSPRYLKPFRQYVDAVGYISQVRRFNIQTDALAPSVFVIRKGTIDFVSKADKSYSLLWNYYKAGALLTSNIENEWLAEASEWLIGEAGYRIAMDLRDATAKDVFDDMRQRARAAVFGDILADEDAGGPIQMGEHL
jgi:hypothetical protein